jgi:hypothetical protein
MQNKTSLVGSWFNLMAIPHLHAVSVVWLSGALPAPPRGHPDSTGWLDHTRPLRSPIGCPGRSVRRHRERIAQYSTGRVQSHPLCFLVKEEVARYRESMDVSLGESTYSACCFSYSGRPQGDGIAKRRSMCSIRGYLWPGYVRGAGSTGGARPAGTAGQLPA